MDLSVTPCRRCKQPAKVVTRTEPFCHDCFTNFIEAKMKKRLAEYGNSEFFGAEERSYLVPLSFGSSSLSLLVALDRFRASQAQKFGQPKLRLHVVHILYPGESSKEKLHQLSQLFPECNFSSHHITSVFDPEMRLEPSDRDLKLNRFLETLSSITAKDDVLRIFLVRSVVQFAKWNKFNNILWGDTTTRLAERVLSETSKGRGFSLPWQVTDGETPFGVNFWYPFRDVLGKEVTEYSNLTDVSVKSLLNLNKPVVPINLRNTSIDQLMNRYFEIAEEQYPNIVTNVVRTSTKLILGPVSLQRCKLCLYPVMDEQRGEIASNLPIDVAIETVNTSNIVLCYACARNITSSTIPLLP